MELELRINGVIKSLDVAPNESLMTTLRNEGYFSVKHGCETGECGACTVLVNGRRVNSCLALAIMKDGAQITTVEGLAQGNVLHPVQQAFIDHDAFQCGYCTPGQICSAVGLIAEGKARAGDEIRELMSGNICRCGAYPNIVAAIEEVMGNLKQHRHSLSSRPSEPRAIVRGEREPGSISPQNACREMDPGSASAGLPTRVAVRDDTESVRLDISNVSEPRYRASAP